MLSHAAQPRRARLVSVLATHGAGDTRPERGALAGMTSEIQRGVAKSRRAHRKSTRVARRGSNHRGNAASGACNAVAEQRYRTVRDAAGVPQAGVGLADRREFEQANRTLIRR